MSAAIASACTVTVQTVVILLLLFAVATMVAVPTDVPVTVPFSSTAAASLLLDHVTVLSTVLAGKIVAERASVLPTCTVAVLCERRISCAFTSVTVIFLLVVTFG